MFQVGQERYIILKSSGLVCTPSPMFAGV